MSTLFFAHSVAHISALILPGLSSICKVFINLKLNLQPWESYRLDEFFTDRLCHRGSGRLDLIHCC